ncbi:hypothetical protein Bca52824_033915 [Brassica carinata]|uniref:At2g35280-like TPR domain-containing protein n=1 Tax=Brassica carinata TaxID=52824 RepID=A0A8X7V7I0_BRACI|nr:hypothetical protein Bca52824_033915 [Brassica carinata]
MEYFPLLELPEAIQALVVERVARNSILDLFCVRESSKWMKALADRRRVYNFFDVLSVPWDLDMPSQFLKSCYEEGNPSTIYIKGAQFVYTFAFKEEGLALMKRAAEAGYERAVYLHAITRVIFWSDGQYINRIPRESAERIEKLVRSVKWGWGGNPSTIYIKGAQFVYTFAFKEEGLALMKRAAEAGYERAVYLHAITRVIFWSDGQYINRIPRESAERIEKLVRSVKWGWGLWHYNEFHENSEVFESSFLKEFYMQLWKS